jgi:hypothetical protein
MGERNYESVHGLFVSGGLVSMNGALIFLQSL